MILRDKVVNAKEVDYQEVNHYANLYYIRNIKKEAFKDKLRK